MGQLFRMLRASVWLLVLAGLAVQSADAQNNRYPPADDAWDGTSYRALLERLETEGLALPTMSDAATNKIFERMVSSDNIPLRVGLNPDFSVAIRFQRLDGALQPIHDLVALYSNEIQKGKSYGSELHRLMAYESRITAALLSLSDAYLSTLSKDKRYQVHVDYINRLKRDARQLYLNLVQAIIEPRLRSKSDTLNLITVAFDGLPAYQQVLTSQDRADLLQKLAEPISVATDQELKAPLVQLRDAIENRRSRTEDEKAIKPRA
jgi:hypothetical protein